MLRCLAHRGIVELFSAIPSEKNIFALTVPFGNWRSASPRWAFQYCDSITTVAAIPQVVLNKGKFANG